MTNPSLKLMLSSPVHLLSLGFGTGLAPVAPGTIGTLIGFPLFWLVNTLPVEPKVVTYVGLFVLGCWLCAVTGKALGVHDHSGIVWDEIVAMAMVLEFVPQSWIWWVAAFLAFRLFDITKPWPVYLADNTKGKGAVAGGFFVMLDDVLAAGYAVIALVFISYVMPVSG